MTTSEKGLLQALEFTTEALRQVLLEVGSIKRRMKQLEVWQNTMDMILKRM